MDTTNTKVYKRIYANKLDNLGKNWQILRNVHTSKTEPGRNRKQEQINLKYLWLKNSTNKSPGLDGFTGKLSNIERRANTYPFETIPKNYRERINVKFILWDSHQSDTKTSKDTIKIID